MDEKKKAVLDETDAIALNKENERLQTENATLRLLNQRNGVCFDPEEDAIEPTLDEEAAWLHTRLNALKREREALQNVLCLGEELQGLQETNDKLREATNKLAEENSSLQAENDALEASQTCLVSTEVVPSTSSPSVAAVAALGASACVPAPKAVCSNASLAQRSSTAALASREISSNASVTKLSARVAGTAAQMAQAPSAPLSTGYAATSAVSMTQAAAVGCTSSAAPMQNAGAPLPPVSMGAGGQCVAEGTSRGDSKSNKDQQRELIASMIKTGLFCAPPGALYATGADERTMEYTMLPAKDRSIPESSSYLAGVGKKVLAGVQPPRDTEGMPASRPPSDVGSLAKSNSGTASLGSAEVPASRKMDRYTRDMALKKQLDRLAQR